MYLSHALAMPLSSSPPPVSSSISALAGSAYVLPVPNFTWLSTSTVIFDAKKFGSDATDAFYDRLTSSADLDFEKLTQRTTLSRRWWRQVEINQLSDQSTYVCATLFLYLKYRNMDPSENKRHSWRKMASFVAYNFSFRWRRGRWRSWHPARFYDVGSHELGLSYLVSCLVLILFINFAQS